MTDAPTRVTFFYNDIRGAQKANIPEDAEREEARQASDGQEQPSENKPDSKPEGSQSQDNQSEGGDQPTNIGEARQQAQVRTRTLTRLVRLGYSFSVHTV